TEDAAVAPQRARRPAFAELLTVDCRPVDSRRVTPRPWPATNRQHALAQTTPEGAPGRGGCSRRAAFAGSRQRGRQSIPPAGGQVRESNPSTPEKRPRRAWERTARVDMPHGGGSTSGSCDVARSGVAV